jgi:hypothetical protein
MLVAALKKRMGVGGVGHVCAAWRGRYTVVYLPLFLAPPSVTLNSNLRETEMTTTNIVPKSNGKADAAIKADAAKAAEKTAQLSNRASEVETLLSIMAEYGKQAATGAASMTDAAMEFGTACGSGLLDAENDAARVYLAYVNGFNQAATTSADVMDADEKKGAKHPISIFRTFGKIGPAQLGRAFWADVVRVRTDMRKAMPDVKFPSVYNCLVLANRKAADKAAEMKLLPSEVANKLVVADETLQAWLEPKPKADKSKVDELEKVLDTLRKMVSREDGGAFPMLQSEVYAHLDRYVTAYKAGKYDAVQVGIMPQSELIRKEETTKH